MQATIQYIEQELSNLYPKNEIRAFTRLILEHVCGMNFTRQQLMRNMVLQDSYRQEIRQMIERLKKYEPVQYILGETEFLGMRLEVNGSVLIPRPETEELVDWIAESGLYNPCQILDVGAGSGCIALGLKNLIPEAAVYGCDISADALQLAQRNAAINGLEVSFFEADILNWERKSWLDYSLIVSNPPYVRISEKKKMEQNVLCYEPETALFVPDSDPLKYYKAIAAFANTYLESGGWLYFEINELFGSELMAIVSNLGFSKAEIKKDLSGKDRMLRCCRL